MIYKQCQLQVVKHILSYNTAQLNFVAKNSADANITANPDPNKDEVYHEYKRH